MTSDKERRIESIREEALARGRIDGIGVRPAGSPFPVASSEAGYYGVPLLKRPTWTWEIPLYFFVGGAAGGSAVLAAVARIAGGDPRLARDSAWIAAGGAMLSAPLLISDLGKPSRFFNMLRVIKLQSPMSVGAWTLVLFSTASSAAVAAGILERRARSRTTIRVLSHAAHALGALTGLSMMTYTGVLLGVTAVPVWSRNAAILPVEFGTSALGSAVSLLEVSGHRSRALRSLGIASSAAETVMGAIHEAAREPALEPAKTGRAGVLLRAGGVLSGPIALALRLMGRRKAAAVATLGGSLLLRYGWLEAGRASADDWKTPLGIEAGVAPDDRPVPLPETLRDAGPGIRGVRSQGRGVS